MPIRGLAALFLAFAVGGAACGVADSESSGNPQYRDVPTSNGNAKYEHHFASVEEMAKASDYIVVAQVDGHRPGRTAQSAHELRWTVVSLNVIQTIKGPADLRTLGFEQLTHENGLPLLIDGVQLASVGDRGIFFLTKGRPQTPDLLVLINNQAQYLEREGQLSGSDPSDTLVQALSRLSLEQLAERVESALP